MQLKEIFENIKPENYIESVKQMYSIHESDNRDWNQLSEFEKDIYCWITNDIFNEDRVIRIQKQIDERLKN